MTTAVAVRIPGDVEFEGGDFLEAPELEALGRAIIERDDRFEHLREWQNSIAWLWKRKGGKKGGKEMLGACQPLSGYAQFKAGRSYLIWLAADACRRARMAGRQMEACVYHQLCHLAPGEDADEAEEMGLPAPSPVIVGHDYEGFLDELRAFGAWRPDLEEAEGAFRQMPLFG